MISYHPTFYALPGDAFGKATSHLAGVRVHRTNGGPLLFLHRILHRAGAQVFLFSQHILQHLQHPLDASAFCTASLRLFLSRSFYSGGSTQDYVFPFCEQRDPSRSFYGRDDRPRNMTCTYSGDHLPSSYALRSQLAAFRRHTTCTLSSITPALLGEGY
jgi:hypothetical protein